MISQSEKIKIDRLLATFEQNFALTQMYAQYLERYPELITAEMIDTLTEDGTVTKKDAIVALLSEVFALSFENPSDRSMIMNYLTPSVKILDEKRYTENPYYKNIDIPNVKDGTWELRRESYAPYRAVVAGDIIFDGMREIVPLGFFTEEFDFPAVLEDGNEWMTLTPVDLDTSEDAIAAARGKVVTFGLGLGYFAYMASEKPTVESVTVVEKSRKVIELFKKYILPQFPNSRKIRIVEADAFEYAEHVMPSEGFDFAFVDTWRDSSDGAPMYKRMKSLECFSHGTEFMYWIENFLISRLRALRFEKLVDRLERYEVGYSEALAELNDIL